MVASLLPSARVGLCAYDLGKFYGEFSELVRRTGIRPLRPYCQRHTCYTRLCESGAPQPVINAIIGHSNGKLGDTYKHRQNAKKANNFCAVLPLVLPLVLPIGRFARRYILHCFIAIYLRIFFCKTY